MFKRKSPAHLAASLGVVLALALPSIATGAERELIVGTPTATSVNSAKMTAAIELGYFAKEGIKIKMQSFPTTIPIMQATAAKTIDVGGGGVFPLVVANQPGANHMPIKFFYNHIRSFAFEIVVPANSPLKSIANLKGKKLGVLNLTTSPYLPVTRSVLKENGLGPNDVELVPTGENRAAFDLLAAGKIDAYETFNGNSANYEAEGNKLRRLPYDQRITNLMTYSYYAHEDALKKDPKLFAGYGRGIAKGVITCNIAPEWCVKTLWKYFPHLKPAPEAMDKEIAHQVYILKDSMKGHFAFPAGKPRRFGEYPDDAFKNLIAILSGGGEVSGNFDPESLYTNDLVSQINDFDVAAVEAKARTLK